MENLLQKLRKARNILEFLAILNTYMELNNIGKIIITGGFAVELYTNRAYRTGDVDIIVVGNKEFLEQVLNSIGRRSGRVWELEYFSDKAIDIVSTMYIKPKSPVKLRVGERWIYVEPVEEIIITCLAACKFWQSDIDCEKAAMLLVAQRDHIDWEYLMRRAEREEVLDKLFEIKKKIEEKLR